MPPLLAAERLRKTYGALTVTDDLSFEVAPGEALGVLGPNGAGKTTLFNIVGGDIRPDAGRVMLDGLDVTHLSAEKRCHLGIGRTYQIPRPFTGMTVYENVLVGATFGRKRSERDSGDVCRDVLSRTGLLEKAGALAGGLRLLDRKRLELARALATEPSLLLLDEIAGGLTETEIRSLIALIAGVRSHGTAIVWIEHVVHALAQGVDQLMAMNFGRLLARGTPAEVLANPAVRDVYLGVEE